MPSKPQTATRLPSDGRRGQVPRRHDAQAAPKHAPAPLRGRRQSDVSPGAACDAVHRREADNPIPQPQVHQARLRLRHRGTDSEV